MHDILLYIFGGVGALIYSFPVYLAAMGLEPPSKFALASLAFSVFVGAIIAPVLVQILGHRWPFMVLPEPYPLAVGIGLAANPLVPVFIRRVTGWAESYNIGAKKP
jgi:hypothetical protein